MPMDNRRERLGRVRSAFCLECQLHDQAVSVVLSIPGREGTVTRAWSREPGAGLTAPSWDDLRAWVDLALTQWYQTAEGVQGSLW